MQRHDSSETADSQATHGSNKDQFRGEVGLDWIQEAQELCLRLDVIQVLGELLSRESLLELFCQRHGL